MKDREIMGGFRTINPATEETIKEYQYMTKKEASKAVEDCHHAFLDWKTKSVDARASIIKKIGEVLMERREEFAKLMTQEMGKVVKHGFQEIKLCAGICEYTATTGIKELEDEERELPNGDKGMITYSPVGVIYGIQPWNFPCYQAVRYAIASLAAGNGVLLKHAECCTGSALLLQEIMEQAGLPKNLFKVLLINNDQSNEVIANTYVRGVTFTGSLGSGKIIAQEAAKHAKKTVLELGSNDAYIVLEDADIAMAAETCVQGRIYNNGEVCIAAKRFVVVESVYEEFKEKFIAGMNEVEYGDPTNRDTAMGPLARKDLREKLHDQVTKSVDKGAEILLGGKMPNAKGFFYPATILGNVQPGQPAYEEEFFGPVASLIKAKDQEDAMRIANDSRFGLGGGIFSENIEKAVELAKNHFDTGMVFINSASDNQPNMPFGGVKDSGYGREHGGFGIKEFVNVKSIMPIK
ncbi:NAD-dependent succinate-semialdehyde dehydrogenase [uncultured Dokdonia sp.]|uniref:NAD-dependent succinate-semialdehyde dehydrogenase n=1 Tax=uncultured Dokdonia sp. TaxID=575653 RepID=UPI002601CFF2|nr:NAD-dependent succinate-semialdehyde dehydrogenase [uncultured Dokdonia sp.]